MNAKRKQILCGLLGVIDLFLFGDYLWQDRVQKPLTELKGDYDALLEDLKKQTGTFKRTKELPIRIAAWKKPFLSRSLRFTRKTSAAVSSEQPLMPNADGS